MDSPISKEDKVEAIADEKKNLVSELHNKKTLPSLRTYQGDIASFIQSKDQTITEIALKNKKAKEDKENNKLEEEKKYVVDPKKEKPKKIIPQEREDEGDKSGGTNILMIILGIFLAIASVLAIAYAIYNYYNRLPVITNTSINEAVLKTTNSIIIDSGNLETQNIYASIKAVKQDPKYKSGIISIEIPLSTSQFIEKMKWGVPAPLTRSMEDTFMLGVYRDETRNDTFMIFKIKDYGIAFRDMLAWETTMFQDLKPILNADDNTTVKEKFTDSIVKNKDTRSLLGNNGKTSLTYTFLDSKTILITESDESLIYLLNAFINKNIIR